jgi:hypothetical protein
MTQLRAATRLIAAATLTAVSEKSKAEADAIVSRLTSVLGKQTGQNYTWGGDGEKVTWAFPGGEFDVEWHRNHDLFYYRLELKNRTTVSAGGVPTAKAFFSEITDRATKLLQGSQWKPGQVKFLTKLSTL